MANSRNERQLVHMRAYIKACYIPNKPCFLQDSKSKAITFILIPIFSSHSIQICLVKIPYEIEFVF